VILVIRNLLRLHELWAIVKALEDKEKNIETLTSKLKEATEAVDANEKLLRDVNNKVLDSGSQICCHVQCALFYCSNVNCLMSDLCSCGMVMFCITVYFIFSFFVMSFLPVQY